MFFQCESRLLQKAYTGTDHTCAEVSTKTNEMEVSGISLYKRWVLPSGKGK